MWGPTQEEMMFFFKIVIIGLLLIGGTIGYVLAKVLS